MKMNDFLLDTTEIDDTFKAFVISLSRMIINKPEFLLVLAESENKAECKDLFNELQNKTTLENFSNKVQKAATSYNWDTIKNTYVTWGKFGWISDSSIVPFGFWGQLPKTQSEADSSVLRHLNKAKLSKIIDGIFDISNDPNLYHEAILCFNNKCYTACASLLLSLIDGELIRCKCRLAAENKKTGLKAGERVVNDMANDDMYGLPGYFNLELMNYKSYISTIFESAQNFKNEPRRLNRNYLQHGMSKRKVLKKDCIKLLIAYRKTINITKNFYD
ncbi:MAG: hypothetical protein IKU15_09525 [Clostridia bacterium]|nr:hypothetical protein [Clostridia bacterium]